MKLATKFSRPVRCCLTQRKKKLYANTAGTATAMPIAVATSASPMGPVTHPDLRNT